MTAPAVDTRRPGANVPRGVDAPALGSRYGRRRSRHAPARAKRSPAGSRHAGRGSRRAHPQESTRAVRDPTCASGRVDASGQGLLGRPATCGGAAGRSCIGRAVDVTKQPDPPTATVSRMERSTQRLGRALVVIVDDRVVHGEHDDKTGPLVTELLEETGFIVDGTVAGAGETVD